MSCSSPFDIIISSPEFDLINYTKNTAVETTSSFGGLSSPPIYITVYWPVCWEIWEGDCWDSEQMEVFPAVTWLQPSSVTYGVSFNDTIECYGALLSNGTDAGIGLIASWIIQNVNFTLNGNIGGYPFEIFDNTLLVPLIDFTVKLTGDKVALFAEIPLYTNNFTTHVWAFNVSFNLSFDILLCVLPSSSIKLAVYMDIGVMMNSCIGFETTRGVVSAAIPLITAPPGESVLITYLEEFA